MCNTDKVIKFHWNRTNSFWEKDILVTPWGLHRPNGSVKVNLHPAPHLWQGGPLRPSACTSRTTARWGSVWWGSRMRTTGPQGLYFLRKFVRVLINDRTSVYSNWISKFTKLHIFWGESYSTCLHTGLPGRGEPAWHTQCHHWVLTSLIFNSFLTAHF